VVIDRDASRDELLAVIDRLVAANEVLAARVAELERRLGLNSRNSSKPPSSDGLAKPPPRSLRVKSGRKPGKQRGAPGATLMAVDDPDEIVEHRPAVCGACRADLTAAQVVATKRRQVVDLPPVRTVVVEHRVQSCRCVCGVVTAADAPAAVSAPVQYGPGVASMAVYLLVGQHIPFARVVRVLSDLLGCAVSAGWVHSVVIRAATALTGFRETLRAALQRAAVVHFDETGTRVNGHLRWTHVACTPLLTHYHLDEKRGQDATLADGILSALRAPQVAVHDGWRSYFMPPYDAVDHALCNAHHLRELTGWAEVSEEHRPWLTAMIKILQDGNRLVNQAKAAGHTRLDDTVIQRLQRRWRRAVNDGYRADPFPNGRAGPRKIGALLDRMRGCVTEIWRFAHNFAVPFDNNQAERDIRMIKIQPKVSGGWRTPSGAIAWLRIREYLSTTAKHGINALTALRDALTGNAWLVPQPE
jgi:transposase